MVYGVIVIMVIHMRLNKDSKLREYLARVGWPDAMPNNDTLVKIDDTDGECLLSDTDDEKDWFDDGDDGDDENSRTKDQYNTFSYNFDVFCSYF